MKKIIIFISNGIKTIIARWKAESPQFWINVQNIMITIGCSALSILMADKLFDLQGYGVSSVVFKVCGYILTVCAGIGLTAKITVKDGFKNPNNG